MPHRRDVEAAADLDLLGDVRQVHRRHEEIRQALVALVLEVVLGQPDRVVAQLVHRPGDGVRLREHRRQVLVPVAPLVGRGGHLAHVGQIDVAGIDGGEPGDHGCSFRDRGRAARGPDPNTPRIGPRA